MGLGNRGQFGPVGEDTLYYVFILLATGAFMAIVLQAFGDFEERNTKIDMYRKAYAYADRTAWYLAWDYEDQVDTGRARVLEKEKIDSMDCTGNEGVCIIRRRESGDEVLKSCGETFCTNPNTDPDSIRAVARLPVSIRMSGKEFSPGILEVTVIG
ncbi:MAG: hypothetical protein JW724_02990 [Candidatus Altiarchaeota archaeon]|nr:hypothetical protein [Candidatus Altiarchaeota archaeon]